MSIIEGLSKSPRKSRAKKKSKTSVSDSNSDSDSLTEDLERIGNFPTMAEFSSNLRFNLPTLPNFSSSLPELPNLHSFATLPDLPNLPELPNFPNLRNLPELAQLKEYIRTYNERSNQNVNSIRTAISSRIQMLNFMNDLDLGISITSAVERLKPVADIIHETINSPLEDDFVDEKEKNMTEPIGVEPLVERYQPIINEVVVPPKEEVTAKKRTKKRHTDKLKIIEDLNNSDSSLDNITGLSMSDIKELTELESSNDFHSQAILRTRIQKIQSLESVSQSNKNKLITRLMMGNYYKYLNEQLEIKKHEGHKDKEPVESGHQIEPNTTNESEFKLEENHGEDDEEYGSGDSDDEVILSASDKRATFHDETEAILGCQHYQRSCKLECPTCFKWYTCRFCHDADPNTNHQMERNKVKHILCMKCFTPQLPSAECANCEIEFANYYCAQCVLFDDDVSKDIYHCDDCGICRLGLGLGQDFFHCKGCNACLSIDLQDGHKCMENSTQSNCPICGEYMFTSTKTVAFMSCGHSIHQSCFDEYTKHSYKCPICSKTVINMETQFRVLDQEIQMQQLPHPYNNWSCVVSCNDCKGKSNVKYHVLGLRCDICKSYNTAQLKLNKPEESDYESDNQFRDNGLSESRIFNNGHINVLNSNYNVEESTAKKSVKNEEYDDVSSDEEAYKQDFLNFRAPAASKSPIKEKKETGKESNNVNSITSVISNLINNARRYDEEKQDHEYDSYDSDDNIGGF